MDEYRSPNKSSSYRNHNRYTPRYQTSGLNVTQIIESEFSKRKCLKNGRNRWKLPRPAEVFSADKWELSQLKHGKTELNSKKNRLSGFNMKSWHQHTRITNCAGNVVNIVRKEIGPELLTQAWCKFYEIVSSYNLVAAKAVETDVLNSLHLCEAPGAFITSLNHFLKLRHPSIKWSWRASTLNPYYEGNKLSQMINDDRFILNTLDSWVFGTDQTGDLFKQESIDSLISVPKQISPVLLVTADGSINCQDDPGEQEVIVSSLHYCETLVALSVLSEGGSYLLKMFTMFECETVCLLYLLCCVFESVEMFKPASSKGGNSEVYIICLNFSGPASVKNYLPILRSKIKEPTNKVMFSQEHLSADFVSSILKCSSYFKTLQISVLDKNILTYIENISDEDKNELHHLRKKLAYSYINRYLLKPLSLPDDYIVGNDIIRDTLTLNLEARNEEWTLSEKGWDADTSSKDKLLELKSQLKTLSCSWSASKDTVWIESDSLLNVGGLEEVLVFGKPVTTVYSSKFCPGSLLHLWNRLCQLKCVNLSSLAPLNLIINKLLGCIPGLKKSSIKTCTMSKEEYHGNVYRFEEQCLIKLIAALKSLEDAGDLLLIGVPLLTRFSVGLVYFIAQLFQGIYFLNPETTGYAMLFHSKREDRFEKITVLENLVQSMQKNEPLALHTFINVVNLVKDSLWYKTIVEMNHIIMRRSAYQTIEDLLSQCSPQPNEPSYY